MEDDVKWALTMAKAIVERLGKGIVYTLRDGECTEYYSFPSNNPDVARTGEKVLALDWVRESDRSYLGFKYLRCVGEGEVVFIGGYLVNIRKGTISRPS